MSKRKHKSQAQKRGRVGEMKKLKKLVIQLQHKMLQPNEDINNCSTDELADILESILQHAFVVVKCTAIDKERGHVHHIEYIGQGGLTEEIYDGDGIMGGSFDWSYYKNKNWLVKDFEIEVDLDQYKSVEQK